MMTEVPNDDGVGAMTMTGAVHLKMRDETRMMTRKTRDETTRTMMTAPVPIDVAPWHQREKGGRQNMIFRSGTKLQIPTRRYVNFL